MRIFLATAFTLTLLALPATASAAEAASEPRGLPFSIADLGWIALFVMLLLVLALGLQTIARQRRRSAGVRVVHQRTDP